MKICSWVNSAGHSLKPYSLDNSSSPSYIKQFESAMIQMDVQKILELIDAGFDPFNCSLAKVQKSPVFVDNLIDASWKSSFKNNCFQALQNQIQDTKSEEFQDLTISLREVILYLKDKIERSQEISNEDLKNYAKEYYRFSFMNGGEESLSLLEIAVFFLENEVLIEKWINISQEKSYEKLELDCCTHITTFLLASNEGLNIISHLMDKGYSLAKILLFPQNSISIFANEFLVEELYHFLIDFPRPSLLNFILEKNIYSQYDLETFLKQELFEGSENLYYYLIESLYEQNTLDSITTAELLLEKTEELAKKSLQNMELELEPDAPNLELRQEILKKITHYKE